MLREVILLVDDMSSAITLVSNLVVFFGGFYIALHSRIIPRWLTTSLWYIGLASLLNAITFVVEWTWDTTHPLSHFQIGGFTEVLMSVSLAATIALLFFNTVWKDYIGSKERRDIEAKVDAKAKIVKKSASAKTTRAAVKSTPVARKTVRKI